MSKGTPLSVRVPARSNSSIIELRRELGFHTDGAGCLEEDVPRWSQDHLVWLCFPDSRATFDCVHSLYREAFPAQTTFYKLLGLHGLFCLAAHLKQNPCAELENFSGLVHAFGASKAGRKTVLNHEGHLGFDVLDLVSPELFVENGVPRSIYAEWHSSLCVIPRIVAYCESIDMYENEGG